MTSAAPRPLANELIDEIIARHAERTGDVLGILEEAQQRHPQNYLPAQTYAYVAQKTGVARSQIMSVVTFYAFFNRAPQGRHTLTVCRGTACHTRGSRQLLAALKAYFGVQDDAASAAAATSASASATSLTSATSFTTPDGRLTIRTVACFGQCALAPVAAIDDAIHGHVSDLALRDLVAAVVGDGQTVDIGEREKPGEMGETAQQESAR